MSWCRVGVELVCVCALELWRVGRNQMEKVVNVRGWGLVVCG